MDVPRGIPDFLQKEWNENGKVLVSRAPLVYIVDLVPLALLEIFRRSLTENNVSSFVPCAFLLVTSNA